MKTKLTNNKRCYKNISEAKTVDEVIKILEKVREWYGKDTKVYFRNDNNDMINKNKLNEISINSLFNETFVYFS